MKTKLAAGLAVISVGTLVWAAKDPVIMTVNGVDVPKSEFEYLYHKNSQQQVEAQPLDEYVEMFELYKMKVADAKEAGIDTLSSFKSEMKQYRDELAAPYLADSIYLNELVNEAYLRSLEEAEANHIMFSKGMNAAENERSKALVDSVRKLLLAGEDFEEIAVRYSVDKSAVANRGHLGFIAAGRYPYYFEKTAFSLAPDEISEPVETPMGYHIMKGGKRRPSQGTVSAAHIMKMLKPGSSPAEEDRAKAEIDSLYQIVIANPDSFEKIAVENSDDTGSARMGGNLGWFGTGQMVPEFSDVAFALEVGEISKPVRSQYGWHIIKKLGAKGPKTLAEMKPEQLSRLNNPRDERYKLVKAEQTRKLAGKHKGKKNEKTIARLKSHIARNGVDSTFYSTFKQDNSDIFTVEGKPVSVGYFVTSLEGNLVPDAYYGDIFFTDRLDAAYNEALVDAEENALLETNKDYKNLLNEYEEGSLLYEISLRKVWDKAAQDNEGLEKYFSQHKDEYKWQEPKAKGILVQAKSDSVADLVRNRYAELGGDTAIVTLRKEFRNEALIDKVLAQRGVNKIVDYLMFDGDEPGANNGYGVFFILEPRIITAPEEMNDVKGLVTADYQTQLEQNWTTELKKKYPVKVNEKVLRQVK